MTKQNILIAILVVAGLLYALGINPIFIVDITETVFVTRLQKPLRDITKPGLYFKVPFVDEVRRFDKRLLDYDRTPQDVITRDKKTMQIDNFAKWRIVDPTKVFQRFGSQAQAKLRLHDWIYSELRVELGRHDLSEIVSEKRSDIMKIVTERANKKSVPEGIQIVDVRIKRADLPEQNERAVFQRMQAEREREAKQYRAQGAEEAQKIRSEAEKDREILLAQAYKTSEELKGGGDAKAFKVYAAAYRKGPKFFAFTRSMEAYKKSFGENSTIVMGPDSEFFKFLKKR